MAIIIQTADKTFTTDNGRGTTMELSYNEVRGYWQMMSDNVSRRAWGGLGIKTFRSLAEVEKSYKTWRGISELVEAA